MGVRYTIAATLLSLTLALGCVSDPPTPGSEADRLVVILDGSVKNLDPRFTVDGTSMKVSRLVFSNLVTVDNEAAEPELQLARSIEPDPTSRDAEGRATRWVVTLRDDVRWHDGQPLTARDVVYTYRSILDPALGSPYRGGYARKLAAVESVPGEPLQVAFVLHRPYATFLTDLVMGIVPAHVLEGSGGDAPGRFPEDEIVGCGPYRFHSRLGERRLVLQSFTDHYEGAPPTRWLVFRTIEDASTRILALVGGSGDLMVNGVSPVLLDVVAEEPDLVVESAPSLAWTYLAFNLRDPLLSDIRVRRALSLAIDRGEIIRRKFKGHAAPSVGMMAPVSWAHAAATPPPQFDPTAAEALLDAAGLPRDPETGVRMRLSLKLSTDRFRRSVARTMVDQLARIGVAVELRSFETGTFLADIRKGNFQATLLKLPDPSEPDMLRWMFFSLGTPGVEPANSGPPAATADRRYWVPGLGHLLSGEDEACARWARQEVLAGATRWAQRAWGATPPRDRANRTYFSDPRVDCLLMRGWAEPDRSRRKPLYDEVQAILARELPVLPLWHEHNVVVRRSRVSGFELLPNGRWTPLARTKIIRSE